MTNGKQIIDGRNKNKLSTNNVTTEKGFSSCRRTDKCPMQNKRLSVSIVYQATVTTNKSEPKQFKRTFVLPKAPLKSVIIKLSLPTQPNEMRLNSVTHIAFKTQECWI